MINSVVIVNKNLIRGILCHRWIIPCGNLKSNLNDSCWVGELPLRCAEPTRAESKKSIMHGSVLHTSKVILQHNGSYTIKRVWCLSRKSCRE